MAKTRKLVIKPLAVRDIDRQAAYLSTVRGQLGERFVRSVRAATEKIARQPTIGSQLPQGEDDIYMLALGRFRNHLLIYRTTPESIEILRVLHSAQDWSQIDLNG